MALSTEWVALKIGQSGSGGVEYSLIGGAGTTYDPTFIDATAARIDGGSENPGYFTDIKDKAAESVADQTPSADNSEDEESTDTNN